MKTLQIVGFKNSGKTTLIARWVRLLKQRGVAVAVLKHHGHSSPLDMPDAETDTMQFFANGADVSVVAGGGAVQLHMNQEPDFIRMKEIASINRPDVILIEGYKKEEGEKVVLLRNESDWGELRNLQGVRLVVGAAVETNNPQITSRESNDELDRWLVNWLEEDSNETI